MGKLAYNLKVLDKHTGRKSKVGVGFLNEDESISVVLNDFTQLTWDKDLVITLFPKTAWGDDNKELEDSQS